MFTSFLLPVDLNSEASWRKALPAAVKLAQDNGAMLHLLTVVPEFGLPMVAAYFPPDYEARMIETARDALERFCAEHIPAALKAQAHVAHGTIYREILDHADRIGADVIVMASHRPEMSDYLLGPNAARVARHARQSVFIVRA